MQSRQSHTSGRAAEPNVRKNNRRWVPIAVAALLSALAVGAAGFTLYRSSPQTLASLNPAASLGQTVPGLVGTQAQPTVFVPTSAAKSTMAAATPVPLKPKPTAAVSGQLQLVPTRAAPRPTAAPPAVNKQVAIAEGLAESKQADAAEASCPKPAGQIITHTLSSKITAAPITVHVYLPPCYNAREYTYPTLYLIHGTAFEQGGWIYDGVPRVADIQMSIGALPPFIIVMPGADMRAGDASKYAWSNWGENSYEGFVIDELVPFIDGKYSTWASREGRAIGGISRGGYWSIQIGFSNPDKFSTVGGHSPSVDQMLVGMPANFSMLDTAKSVGALHTLRIWLDAGSEDWARFDAKKLADELDNEGVAYAMDVGPGGHEDSYWTSRVPDYLAFYATSWPRTARARPAIGQGGQSR